MYEIDLYQLDCRASVEEYLADRELPRLVCGYGKKKGDSPDHNMRSRRADR